MSFQAIHVFYFHFGRDVAGIAGLSSNPGNAVDSDHPLDFLIDDRTTTKMKFATAETDHYIDFDFGADHAEGIDSIIIPVGHSLDGIALDLLAENSFPPTESQVTNTPSGDGVIRLAFSEVTRRYWRLEMNTIGAHELPQIILSRLTQFDAGPNMRRALDSFRHSFQRFEQPSGITPTIEQGVRRRLMEIIFERVQGEDLSNIEEWIETSGMHRVFWINPWSFAANPAVTDPTTPFKFEDEPEALMGVAVPNTEVETKKFTLNLIESVD